MKKHHLSANKSLILLIFIFALFPLCAHAQHEISLYGGGGLSGLSYNATAGQQKNGFGGQFGLGYCYFFTSSLGAGTGIEYAVYSAKFNANVINSVYSATDPEGVEFEFRSVVSGIEEKQNATFLQIPLMLQYQNEISKDHWYYIVGGVKAGIPLSGKYSNTVEALNNSGFYSEEVYEYTTQQFIGFGTFNNRTSKGSLDFTTVFFLSLEAGVKFMLSGKSSLYVGAYLDYGLNNIAKKTSLLFVEYNTSESTAFETHSIANSKYAQNGATASFTKKITPIASGVKIIFALGL